MNLTTTATAALLLATASWGATASTVGLTNAGQPASLISLNDLKAVQESKVTARQAIAAAQARSNGGDLVDLKFDASTGTPVYKVRTRRDLTVWDSEIDARTGQVIGAGATTPEAQLGDDDRSELAGLVRVPSASLLQAVVTAENSGGKVVSAEVEEINGRSAYELIVVKNGSPRRLVYRTHYH
ncbi:MAG: hypothetical protein QOI12_2151 [Alphaproteobacteria bacterium]|jgi:uncharacterized membrane protein YkoI|nr:hypothetical protein [Alphaproteobacteria bacterium]